MGTHPIFESDFDCLTEMGDAPPEHQDPNIPQQDPNVPPQNVDALFTAHVSVLNFFAANGWYIVFAFVIFSFLWKNLEARLEALRRSWQDAQIKKDPDAYYQEEEKRMARLAKIQAQYDQAALVRKEREAEIAAARKERDEAALKHKGKESMKRWQDEQSGQNEAEQTDEKPKTTQRKKPSTFKRAEYNPLMGSGGSGGFKSTRRPARGG